VPGVTPVTTPVDDTVALVLLALHVPPVVAFDNVMVAEVFTVDGPVIAGVVGSGLIVMIFVADVKPQLLVTV
jgi:hypothetical protein